MTTNEINIRSIGSLLNEKFRVPRYQRGYRWDKQQITELLDDILEYSQNICKKSMNIGKFYCLQPIVVRSANWKEKRNNEAEIEVSGWDIIDGQQRLTTLFVILSYLDEFRITNYDGISNKYSITFETRDECIEFIGNNGFKQGINENNIDFYHISKCYQFVDDWFKDKLIKRLEILKTILDNENNISVIWYEIKDDSDPIDIFTRLNIGKIPLTDAELIKALILQGDKYPENEQRYVKQRLDEIAAEWDEMEKTFKDEKFWYFLTNDDKSVRGIEFIFNLLANEWNEEIVKNDKNGKINIESKRFAYIVFNKYIEHKRKEFLDKYPDKDKKIDYIEPINDIWKDIKELFCIFAEWYSNHTLYHYIGFLLTVNNKDIKDLIHLSKKTDKSIFVNELRRKIGIEINYKVKKNGNSNEYKNLSDYAYNEDNNIIINILLLFNIETIIKSFKKENYRFPFHLYKKEKIYSIEHIHPQNPEDISDDEIRAKKWIKGHEISLSKLNLDGDDKEQRNQFINEIKELLKNYNKTGFHTLINKIFNFYDSKVSIKETEVHSLYNLTLVDKDTNSALNNSFFDVKREILKANERGRYIPICTIRVFEKYYSDAPDEMIFWNDADRIAYFKAIENVCKFFINLIN